MQADLGMIGLGVMGRNLALNLADHGYGVMGLDRSDAAVQSFLSEGRQGKGTITGTTDRAELIRTLKRPRAILLLIPAGAPVDEEIDRLMPLLEAGDCIIDGGNSHYRDTVRRAQFLKNKGLNFLGLGISGGEKGARHGPSLMGGGTADAYVQVGAMLEKISAKVQDRSCFAVVGPDGAGHFVKTLHNGIEYALMQLIAEVYQIGRYLYGLDIAALRALFVEWEKGPLGSFLISITADILASTDAETGRPMLDIIADRASQKGTGQWSAAAALEYGVPAPTIAEAVHARCISALRLDRIAFETSFGALAKTTKHPKGERAAGLEAALLSGFIAAYAQGFSVIAAASAEHHWKIDLARLAEIWQGGCIIRARLLDPIAAAFRHKPDMKNLLADQTINQLIRDKASGLRTVVAEASLGGIAAPALASALAYFDAMHTGRLWANVIEAQRDYFGAHGFERLDRPGKFHRQWQAPE